MQMIEAICELVKEHGRSLEKHGDWAGYTGVQIHKAVVAEYNEYLEAVIAEDVNGKHGQCAELLQLANVAMKGYMRLKNG